MDISDTLQVVELNYAEQVNSYLKNGWKLLSTGFEAHDGESTKVYILGAFDAALIPEKVNLSVRFESEK